MYAPAIHFGTFGSEPAAYQDAAEQELVSALQRIDEHWLRLNPAAPLLYDSGVRYKRQRWAHNRWDDVPTMLSSGSGNCAGLGPWRAAELVVRFGIPARAVALAFPEGNRVLYHIIVESPHGREDPSANLGMTSL